MFNFELVDAYYMRICERKAKGWSERNHS